MPQRFNFDGSILRSVVGGRSAIDMPKLNIHSLEAADSFLLGYGFRTNDPDDQERMWYFYRRSLVLVEEKLNFSKSEIPDVLLDRKALKDIRQLLIWASQTSSSERQLQRWSCAILRVMHVFVHAEQDLFSSFSEEIQKQILSPFQASIFHDGTSGNTFLRKANDDNADHEPLELLGFEIKPFKTSSSTVIKLLAKPDALAMNVFDKLGLRFITKSTFDSFRVIRFLVEESLMSFPHIIPDQSSNNLYPVEMFINACEELQGEGKKLTSEQVNQYLNQKLSEGKESAEYLRKVNSFSGADYKFLKFICRRLIHVQPGGNKKPFSFFYPYEVQIMDNDAHERILSGPSEHQAYKERQRQAARSRLFPEVENP